MNNKPITARVKSGMFKTKEPLLNVGPAGVDGNNTTRTMPSPSKMKGYKMKSSPFKQNAITDAEKENEATIEMSSEKDNAGVKANTVITKETPDSPGADAVNVTTNYDELQAGKIDKGPDYEPPAAETARANKEIEDAKAKDKALSTPGTKGTKGKTTTKKGTSKIYEESKGQAQSAYDRRNNARAGRRTDREVNRASRKLGKYGTYDQEGKFTQRKDLSQREIRKLGVARNALDRAGKESENVQQQSLQNVGGFSEKEVKNVDRRKTKGSYTPEEQANMPDEVRNKTSFSKFKAKKETMDPISFTPMSKKELSAGLESRGEAPKEKQSSFEKSVMDSPFFKKKSPMKMNYFKK